MENDNFSQEEKDRLDIVSNYNFFATSLNEKILRSCFHDIKNLVCGISMFAELMALKSSDDKCQKIINTAWKTQEIIKALQTYTFCYEAKQIYEINNYIENFFKLLPHVKEFGSIKFNIKLTGKNIFVEGNCYLLQQALCAISLYFSPAGEGEVFVSTGLEKEKFIVLTITTGVWKDNLKDFHKDSKDYQFCAEVASIHKGHFEINKEKAVFTFPVV